MVVSTYRGQFDDYDATLTANEDGTLRLEGSVKPGSVVVKDENLAGHLASPIVSEIRDESQRLTA